ncbi:MAG TPA: S8 family serine peptidase [Burkholderiaceae bacterium]|nr:S8 family serine peptidase [Burkholderiaceae bacterium]
MDTRARWMKRFALILGLAALAPLVGAAPKSQDNSLGVVVVRFKAQASADQMRGAIAQAGGEVVTDLSKLGRMSAKASDDGFTARIKSNPLVAGAFTDKVFGHPGADVSGNDAGVTGGNDPQLGNPGPNGPPDPWHNLASFLGETNPEGILQWDDNRMNVPAAWAVTTGNRSVRVAVIDSGVQGSHKELLANYDNQASTNTIPCNLLTRQFGPLGKKDCSSEDTEGHGTWVASRIAGAANGFASNGVAPNVQIVGYKALSTTLGGGLTSWITDAMVQACDANVDLINMSLGGYDVAGADDEDYLLWVDAVNYCRAKGTAIFASAGNEHVRVHKVNMLIGGRSLVGVGRVDAGLEGIQSIIPGDTLANNDLRGLLLTPGGVPGVIMVSATGNAIGGSASSNAINANAKALVWPDSQFGLRDQLTYYSNYGSRVDIAAPGGARKFNIPRYDVGDADILYGGWGSLGALDPSGEICTDPASASLLTFACFKVQGSGFGWLQGTSMSSPNATGVAALTLAAHPNLQGNPDSLLARLKATARTSMVNAMGPNDPVNSAPSAAGVPCTTGWCHVDRNNPIAFSDAYGAGMVNAGAAVAP